MSSRLQVFAVTSLGVFMVYLDGTIVNIAFPAIHATFHTTSQAQLSWVLNAYSIVFAALLLAAGQIADRIGRKRVFFTGLAVFTSSSVLCGLAPTTATLITARVLQAIGAAMLGPTSLALLLGAFPLRMRTTVVGLYGAMAALAVALGPSFGSLIVQETSWRWAFLINVPVGLAVWLYGRTILTESSDSQAQGRPDLIGVSLLILTMGSLALAIVQGNDWGWRDPRMVSAFAAAALSGLLCGWRSTHHPLPILDLSLFRIRSFTIANLATLLFTCAFFAGLLGNVLFLTTAWRYTLMQAGLALTPAPLCAVVAGAAAAHIATSQGHRAVILPGIVVFSVGFLLMMQLGAKPAFLSHWLPINILLGTGVGLALPTLSSASAIFLPAARFAVGSAVFSTARQFGAVIGVAMLIAILGTPTPAKLIESFHHAYGFCLIAAIAVGILCLALEQPGALTA